MLLALVALSLASCPPRVDLDGLVVRDARVTPDGASVVVALANGSQGVLLHLELATGKALRSTRLHSPAQTLAIDSGARHVALLGADREVEIGALDGTRDLLAFTLQRAPKTRVAWSAFGATLEFSPSGDRLLVAVPKYDVVLTDTDGTIVETLTGDCGIYLQRAYRWSPSDGSIVIARLNELEIRDGSTGKPLRSIPALGQIKSLAVHPTRPIAATGHRDGRIRVWSLDDGALLHSFDHVDPFWGSPPKDGEEGPLGGFPHIGWLAYSPDGQFLAYTTATSVHLGVIDTSNAERLSIGPFLGGASGVPATLQWSADSRSVWSRTLFNGRVALARIAATEQAAGAPWTIVHETFPSNGRLGAPTSANLAPFLKDRDGYRPGKLGILDLASGEIAWEKDSFVLISEAKDLLIDEASGR